MGILALVGGDEFRANCVPMDRELLGMIARGPARVVILPTAAAQQGPGMAAANGVRYFAGLGAEASSAMVLTRADADDPTMVAALADADLIYLTGGSPSYLLGALRGSAVWSAIQRRYQEGAMIAGSSAGAMVMGVAMRYGGAAWTPTLGLTTRLAVIPHHDGAPNASQGYTADLRASLPQLAPPPTVVGVATATACIGDDGDEWRVVGVGAVTVYATEGPRVYHAGERFTLA
ncbi:MAG TPA: Type 1 glutamine amidotransferase-like domain-containing protein [Ktedonobacterales bacterium]|nr:Type 1 glutamine amidotransferase-like domain-containing protein [Ktedonobacterales bacterium]